MTDTIQNISALKVTRQTEHSVASQTKVSERNAIVAGLDKASVDAPGLELSPLSPKLMEALQSIRIMRSSIQDGQKPQIAEHLTIAESRIREVDAADDAINLAKSQIMNQSGASALGQPRQDAESLLQLLR